MKLSSPVRLMPMSVVPILRRAAADFRRVWTQLALIAIIYKIVSFALLAPLFGALLRAVVVTSGNSVVADEEILFFLLGPLGLLGLVAIGAVWLAIVAFQQACFIVIAFAARHDRPAGYRAALRYVVVRWRPVLGLAARVTGRALLVAAPFIALGGVVYAWLLTEFDINYYISQKPPEFVLGAALIGALAASMAAALAYRAFAWLYSLPILLFEPVGPAEALRVASERVAGRRRRAAILLAVWGAAAVALSTSSTSVVVWLGRHGAPLAAGSPALAVFLVATILFLWVAVGQISTFVNGSTLALLVAGVYGGTPEGHGSAAPWRGELERSRDRILPRFSPGAILALLGIGFVVALGASFFFLQGLGEASDVQITAHRGAAMWAPENTLASVQRAIDDGTDWVEIDVQETADGRVVVVHDSDFMKLAGVDLRVWEATYDDLRGIDIGSSFAPEFADQRVPALEDVLALCRDRAGLNIELKYYGHDQQLEQRVIDIVEAMEMESQVVVMSLKYEAVQKMRSLRADWTLGLLTAVAVGDLTRRDADFLAVNTGIATPSFVRAAHGAGKEVLVWTVNDPTTVFAMISRGVDGIITDDPAMAKRTVAFFNEMTGVERLMAELAILIGAVELDDDEPEEIG